MDRLRKRSEFQQVYHQGRKIPSRSFTLFLLENDLQRPRLGITVTRRTGCAVRRNRARRLVREWFRRARGHLASVDLVVNARTGLDRLKLDSLTRELEGRLRGYQKRRAKS